MIIINFFSINYWCFWHVKVSFVRQKYGIDNGFNGLLRSYSPNPVCPQFTFNLRNFEKSKFKISGFAINILSAGA